MFINFSQTTGTILIAGTQSVTGSLTATLLTIFIFLCVVSIMFKIPLELSTIILFPVIITMAAYDSTFLKILIAIVIYMAAWVAQHFMFR